MQDATLGTLSVDASSSWNNSAFLGGEVARVEHGKMPDFSLPAAVRINLVF